MNKKQQVILSLLKEIDEICRKHQIEYFLSPRLTLCAVQEQPFPQNPLFGVVLMKVPEMERFRQVMEENPREKRALESMKNHKWFPGFYLRYENTDTVCMNLDTAREYAYPGLGINIYPLRTTIASKMERRKTTIEETGWNELCNIYSKPADMKTRFSKFLIRIRCAVGGQQAQVARMYDNFCRNQQQPDAKKYILKRKKQTTVFPAGVFAKSQTVMLEGIPFQAPGNIRKYLTLSYGDDYKHVTEPQYVMPPQMIISARVSYTQVWKEAGNFEKYCKERRKNVRRLVRSRSMKECFNECWDYVEFCGRRMNLGVTFERRKDYIKNLYKNEDYITLEKVFRSYSKMMEKSFEQGELFAEDDEIFDIYVDVLEKTGKTELREKIRAMI